MKRQALVILLGLITLISVQAQAPEGINYQAVARDGNGDLITSTALSVRITILSGAGASTQEYQETHAVTTNAYGLFTLIVGKGAPVTGTFAGISWGSSPHHLQVEINNGSGFVSMGITQMMSVPYALYAETSGSGGASMALNDLTDVNSSGATANQLLSYDGSNWVPITSSGGTTYSAGAGLSLSGTTFINTAQDQTVTLSGSGSTSVSGTYPNFTISSTDNNTTYSGGTGITLSGTTFNAQTTTALWNANQLRGRSIANTAPSSGQVLGWNGSTWTPTTVSGTSPWTISGANIYRPNGFVGIGTTTPSYSLDVTGIILSRGGVLGANRIGVVGQVVTSNLGGDNYGVYGEAEGGDYNLGGAFFALGSAGTYNYAMYAQALSNNTNYAGYFDGDVVYTGTLSSVSDRRLKKDLTPFTGALNKITGLEIYSYYYHPHGEYENLNLPTQLQYGFMAQDIEEIFPTLVRTNKVPNFTKLGDERDSEKVLEAEYKTVNHVGMIPILIKAIQEQQDMIENQKMLLEKQSEEMEYLKQEINKLK